MGKERPILFSAPMVRAILDGKKTQTRRVVKLPGYTIEERDNGAPWPHCSTWSHGDDGSPWAACPYGAPGDRLWVRETLKISKGGDCGLYAADDAVATLDRWPWQRRYLPSIHMPRWASRITLIVESVRVERLHEIDDAGALAEGVKPGDDMEPTDCPRASFAALWRRINGAESWAANPYVWVVGFSRVTP